MDEAMPPNCIMIIAGEASGDLHGAKLARSIKALVPDTFMFGIGGKAMQSEGVRCIFDSEALSVVGITEVVSSLPTIYRAMSIVKKALRRIKPDLLVLIDYPEFNFLVAAVAKKLNIPVLFYISPQIWAWRQYRVKKIKRLVDHMAVILPFEASFYQEHHVPVTFVGHPLLDTIPTQTDLPVSSKQPVETMIGLLPGSRKKEVATLLPVMLAAAQMIKHRFPETRFIVSSSASIQANLVTDQVDRYTSTLDIEVVKGPVEQVFRRSRLLVAASGTVTLEAALYGVPTVIVYKVSPLSYWLGKRLIKVKHIGMANLIVQKELLPELVQDKASPEAIAETVSKMIDDPEKLKLMQRELKRVRELLGGSGASNRVARIAVNLIAAARGPKGEAVA